MDSITDFHFIRPLWFLFLLPLVILMVYLWKKKPRDTGLESYIDDSLLSHLTIDKQTSDFRLPLIALFLLWIAATVALAGPSWKKIPQAVHSSESAVVIILDLSPSMMAEDVKPSRIVRAHLKIQDFLSRRKDGLTALIVFSGEAHIVTPLTDDTKTISNLLATLKPGILPIPGSNTEMAIDMASDLVVASGLNEASLFLITDNINQEAIPTIKKTLSQSLQLTILGVGTDKGAPIPNGGGFLKDSNGKTLIARRNTNEMKDLASAVKGYYLPMQATSADVDFYYEQLGSFFNQKTVLDDKNRQYDTWYEFAPTLLLIFLPFIALAFRRGLIVSFFIAFTTVSIMTPNIAEASLWESLWKNDDQRAVEAYSKQQYSDAASEFNDPNWKASALYKSQDYEAAVNAFSNDESAIGDYNRGNALAQLQRYDDAIAAYEQAIKKDSSLEAAKKNKKIVEELKKQQEQEKNQDQKNKDSDSNEDSDSSNEKESSDSQSSEQQNTDDNQQQDDTDNQSDENGEQEKENQSESDENKPDDQDKTSQEQQQTLQENNQEKNLSPEEQQALEQWLRKVPDDPSGLLKRKFDYEYNKRRKLYQEGKWDLPENNAHQRY